MANMPGYNVKQYNQNYAITVSPTGRYTYAIFMSGFFIVLLIALPWPIMRIVSGNSNRSDIIGLSVFLPIAILFGYLSISNIKSLIQITEVLLLPEERKIIIRRERSKKIVSEHSIDDISLQSERVMWEDNFQSSKFFTIYDTKLKKPIFSIRPGESQSDDGIACGQLKEFFNEVMYPENRKERDD